MSKIILAGLSAEPKISPAEPQMTSVEPGKILGESDSVQTTGTETTEEPEPGRTLSLPVAGGIAAGLVLVSVVATILIQKLIRKKSSEGKKETAGASVQNAPARPGIKEPNADLAGRVHNVGKRKGQQDSFGVVNIPRGVCAVVADGMGGLADGDKVSQSIVRTMMQDALTIKDSAMEGAKLYSMAAHANREVNRMLGTSGQYKSGSTMIAVLTEGRYFQWISIGDSRIYLFRGNKIVQMNAEHVYERELLLKAVNNRISFAQAATDRQRDRLTSFIGMGDLTHIDGSLHPVEAQAGDRIILMSDGVFNTLSEQEIGKILSETATAAQAAKVLEQWVLARNNPKQDNFTAVILEF